jgi:DNA topoisomerase-1
MKEETTISLTHKELVKIHSDPKKAAKAVDLRYVSDSEPGISRVKKGKGFAYLFNGKAVKNKTEIDRIRKLVLPPAWTKVWICQYANGHLQATGIDALGRKQYKYHSLWQTLRNETKFHRLIEFGKALPAIRTNVEKDICSKELNERKVLATLVSLMERTFIRIGNESYEKMYGSYGLTTLKDAHVNINGTELNFSFKGKKGVFHKIALKSKRLAKIVQACKDIPGKELFQYYDAEGKKQSVDSGTVNNYIREIAGEEFTAKDFRTWAGSVAILQSFRSIGKAASATQLKKNVVAALDEVSKRLGNTRAICKKYYVHPQLIRLYEDNSLDKYLEELDQLEKCDTTTDLTHDEKILMKILKANG